MKIVVTSVVLLALAYAYVLASVLSLSATLAEGLQIPYLHWDTTTSLQDYKSDVQRMHRWHKSKVNESAPTDPPVDLKVRGLAAYLKHNSDYHPRRTLDQFYYSRIEDTTDRDVDQVVFRQTRSGHESTDFNDGSKLVMVDQLWLCLWVVERTNQHDLWEQFSSGVLTSFPHTAYARPDKDPFSSYETADIRQTVLKSLESRENGGTKRATEVASLIIREVAVGTLSEMRKDWSLDFLELFREAIGKAAQDYEMYFRQFANSISPLSTRTGSDRKKDIVDRKKDEVQLGLKIADIIEELQMLRQLFETQSTVLHKGWEGVQDFHCLRSLKQALWDTGSGVLTNYLAEVDRMASEAKRVQKSLMDLLDLQQKEENIEEARRGTIIALFTAKQALSAQDQADATEAQSQILFVFTFVTIVFLPLSFLTSWFGMNIDNGKGTNFVYARSYVNIVMGAASGPIIALLFAAAGAWYFWTVRQATQKRTKDLLDLRRVNFSQKD